MSSHITLQVTVEINDEYVKDVRRLLGGLPGVRKVSLTHYAPKPAWEIATRPQLLINVEEGVPQADMEKINVRIVELWSRWKGYVAMRMSQGEPVVPGEQIVWPQPSPSSSDRTGVEDGVSDASA